MQILASIDNIIGRLRNLYTAKGKLCNIVYVEAHDNHPADWVLSCRELSEWRMKCGKSAKFPDFVICAWKIWTVLFVGFFKFYYQLSNKIHVLVMAYTAKNKENSGGELCVLYMEEYSTLSLFHVHKLTQLLITSIKIYFSLEIWCSVQWALYKQGLGQQSSIIWWYLWQNVLIWWAYTVNSQSYIIKLK